jgi:thiol-disulfide isomerase/thioredoxin
MYMKKTWVIIGGIVVVIAAAMTYLLLTSNKVNSPKDTTQASDAPAQIGNQAQSPQQTETPIAAQPGTYVDYDAESFAKTTGRRVLFFHAPWCPQCRELEQSIKEGKIPAGVTIFKTDFETSIDLRKKYDVGIQTTLIEVGVNGDSVNKYVAYYSPTLQAVIAGMKL